MTSFKKLRDPVFSLEKLREVTAALQLNRLPSVPSGQHILMGLDLAASQQHEVAALRTLARMPADSEEHQTAYAELDRGNRFWRERHSIPLSELREMNERHAAERRRQKLEALVPVDPDTYRFNPPLRPEEMRHRAATPLPGVEPWEALFEHTVGVEYEGPKRSMPDAPSLVDVLLAGAEDEPESEPAMLETPDYWIPVQSISHRHFRVHLVSTSSIRLIESEPLDPPPIMLPSRIKRARQLAVSRGHKYGPAPSPNARRRW